MGLLSFMVLFLVCFKGETTHFAGSPTFRHTQIRCWNRISCRVGPLHGVEQLRLRPGRLRAPTPRGAGTDAGDVSQVSWCWSQAILAMRVGLKLKQEGLRRFWSMFPPARVPSWCQFFEPQPCGLDWLRCEPLSVVGKWEAPPNQSTNPPCFGKLTRGHDPPQRRQQLRLWGLRTDFAQILGIWEALMVFSIKGAPTRVFFLYLSHPFAEVIWRSIFLHCQNAICK